jgi:hypothetical protein
MPERITTPMDIPSLQRLSPAEKVRQRRQASTQPDEHQAEQISGVSPSGHRDGSRLEGRPRTVMPSDALFVKIGTRLPPDLVDWMKQQVAEYRRRNPHAPRLTIEELLRIAIVDLRARGPVDKTVAKYRAAVSSL